MNEFDSKYDILNENTPPNTWLTAHYKKLELKFLLFLVDITFNSSVSF